MQHKILLGQLSLFVCFLFYMVWWYRCYRPGTAVSRASGMNGFLLLLTILSGLAGVILSLTGGTGERLRIAPRVILFGGMAMYILLLIVTYCGFHRQVTTELVLIVGWTMLEMQVINSLNASGTLSEARFWIMSGVLGLAFLVSMVLYVAYYRMEAMKAFYAAMVPLAAGDLAIAVLFLMIFA